MVIRLLQLMSRWTHQVTYSGGGWVGVEAVLSLNGTLRWSGADPGGGGQGGLAPPSPQRIAPPNSQARIQRGQEGLAPPPRGPRGPCPPPYKILDPPMVIEGALHLWFSGCKFESEWEFYAPSASEAIFRARTYSRITYSVRWWWLLDEWK